jgi:hypothetical protein
LLGLSSIHHRGAQAPAGRFSQAADTPRRPSPGQLAALITPTTPPANASEHRAKPVISLGRTPAVWIDAAPARRFTIRAGAASRDRPGCANPRLTGSIGKPGFRLTARAVVTRGLAGAGAVSAGVQPSRERSADTGRALVNGPLDDDSAFSSVAHRARATPSGANQHQPLSPRSCWLVV